MLTGKNPLRRRVGRRALAEVEYTVLRVRMPGELCLTGCGCVRRGLHVAVATGIENVVVVGFSDRKTEAFYRGRRIAVFSGFGRSASRKLDQLDAATGLGDPARPGNRLEASRAGARGSGVSASMTSGRSVSSGRREAPARRTWKSWTAIEGEES